MSFEKHIWGNHTWLFMHVFVEKIKPEYFLEEKSNIISILTKICNNLPCPECSQHASNLMNTYNFNNIRDKSNMKKFVYDFHNHVNKKLNKPEFDFNLLDETYGKVNLIAALHNLNIILNKNINVPKLMMATMHRKSIGKFIIDYFKKNTHKYII
jgi:hypothetical protein